MGRKCVYAYVCAVKAHWNDSTILHDTCETNSTLIAQWSDLWAFGCRGEVANRVSFHAQKQKHRSSYFSVLPEHQNEMSKILTISISQRLISISPKLMEIILHHFPLYYKAPILLPICTRKCDACIYLIAWNVLTSMGYIMFIAYTGR